MMYPSDKDMKGGRIMKNRLTPTQVQQLRANVFVENVTENYVVFTEAFKQLAYDQRQKGKPLREIFRDNGIDPDVIGSLRIYNFSQMLTRRGREGDGFKDRRIDNHRPSGTETAETLEEQVKRLQHELAYTRQEVEFLKKLQMANTEARKQWESKHPPK